jgi:transposase
MLYLGIDLHRKQMTVSLRNESGDVLLRRQVSTRWSKVEEFRKQLHQTVPAAEKYVAVVEVCGFHDWLVQYLRQDERCHQVLVIQPLGRSASKTDRRDAHGLSELLWVNRERLRREDRVQGVRTVQMPSAEEQAERRLTQVRERLVRRRTQTLNQIHKILRRQNLQWEQPTKTFQTVKVRKWLKTIQLEPLDRLAMNQLLTQWQLWDEQLVAADGWIAERFRVNRDAQLLATMPGVSMFIAVAITSRINPIARFPRGRSLANFLGLTPGCRSSGDTERVGSITKVGSRMVRYLLAQVIQHVLRRDATVRAWFQRIKRRRGSKIARVAVMRRTATIMWRMLSTGQPWRPGKADSGTPSVAEDPGQNHSPRDQSSRPCASDCVPGRSSTGASSLLAGEEVASCPA